MTSFVRKLSMNFASRKESTLVDGRGDFLVDSFYSGQTVHAGHSGQVLAERLRSVLENDDTLHGVDQHHRIFCEMLCLQKKDEMHYMWEEKSRWIKYEETVEEGGARWSKPHITLLNMESCLQLKACFKKSAVSLDVNLTTFQDIARYTLDVWNKQCDLQKQELAPCKRALMSKKQHLGKPKAIEGSGSFINETCFCTFCLMSKECLGCLFLDVI
ncbi:unnamed protein product [Soboliphyme baturini]|uniref:Band_3_cyto domain-containing protein n=1 Tax=Soboliphyme baturini TaxID=241478 RepID=A0A183ILP8_9BILA|nr:unnamed protein product [Soboliphyme baturini]